MRRSKGVPDTATPEELWHWATRIHAYSAELECEHGHLPHDPNPSCDCWRFELTQAEVIQAQLAAQHKETLEELRRLTEAMHALGRNILAVNANVTANGQR